MNATYKLEIDWSADGDFGDANEDCSSDLLFPAVITRGYHSPLARMATVGRATFVLDNSAGTYTPASQATVLPRRDVKFTMTYSSGVVLFRGYIESVQPSAGKYRDKRVIIECVDAIALLDQHEGPIALQTGVYSDDIISASVAAVYTPGSTSYQEGLNYFPYSAERWSFQQGFTAFQMSFGRYTQEANASGKILDACASDWGRFFISKSGVPTYYNRHQMPLDTTTDLTLDDTMVELAYQKSIVPIFNQVEVTCYPRTVGEVNEVAGRLSQRHAPVIEASSAETFTIRFRDPSNTALDVGCAAPVTPTAATDFNVTDDVDGEGTDENSNITPSMTAYANKAEVTLTSGVAYPTYVQDLQVRGLVVRAREPVTMVSTDSTSITAYQKRKLPIDAPLMSQEGDAALLADYLLSAYKDPIDDVRGVTIVANSNATLMAAVRDLELMNRVVITETQTGLSSDAFYIYWMEHRINNKYDHRLTFNVEPAYTLAGTPFRLDDSALNSGHVLIY